MSKLTGRTALPAILIGALCSIAIWCAQPVNDFLLRNSRVADNYLPKLGVAMVIVLALVLNPILRWKLPSLALSTKQQALIFAIVLVAGTSSALMQSWPHSLAYSNAQIAEDRTVSDIHKEMDLRDSLYVEPTEYGRETPACSQLIDELDEGNTIPWSAWVVPALSWGSMIVLSLLLMVGLALIVFPQWRDNERLPFPLLTIQRVLIESPEEGKRLPPVFNRPLFWAGAVTVVVIYAFVGLHHHTGDAFPGFKLGWGLWTELEQGITRHMHWYVMSGRIIFTILGITYFVPNRVACSIWVTVLAYQVYRMVGYEFFAPFHGGATVTDHRNGAVLGVAAVVIWLGRRQWVAVFKAMFRPARDDVDRRNRTAGLMFCIGCLGLIVWQLWAGNGLVYSVLAVAIAVITCLVLARIVAETGIPVMGNSLLVGSVLSMLPIGWLSARAIYLTSSVDLIIGPTASQVSASVTAMHGLGIDKDHGPRQHARLAGGLLAVMVAGLFVTGAVHLWTGYHYPAPLDGKKTIGVQDAVDRHMHDPIKRFARGSWGAAPYNRIGHTLLGAVLAVGLQIACLLSPLWPVHPAGLLIMDSEFVKHIWPSVLLGWAVKRAIVMYGGAKAYRSAKPLFLGIVLGEVFSAILWAVVPAVLIWMGGDAAEVGHINIM